MHCGERKRNAEAVATELVKTTGDGGARVNQTRTSSELVD